MFIFCFCFYCFFFLITISKEHQKQLIWQGQQYTFYFLASEVFQFCSPMSYFSPQTLVTFPTHKTVSHWSTALMTCWLDSEQEVATTPDLFAKTFVCPRVGNISSKKLRAFHLTEILGVRWYGIGQDVFSKVTVNLSQLAPPTTKRGTIPNGTLWILETISHIVHGIFWFYHVLHHPEVSGLIEWWSSLLKTSFIAPPRWQYFAELGPCSPGSYTCSKQHSIYGAISLIARIHASKNQGVEMCMIPPTIKPGDQAQFLLPVSMFLCCAGLEVFVPKGEMLPPGDTRVSLIWTLGMPPGNFESKGKKGNYRTGWGGWSWLPRGGWSATALGGKEEHVQNTGAPLGDLSTSKPCDSSQWKTTKFNSGRTTNGTNSSANEGLDHPTKQRATTSWSACWRQRKMA